MSHLHLPINYKKKKEASITELKNRFVNTDLLSYGHKSKQTPTFQVPF